MRNPIAALRTLRWMLAFGLALAIVAAAAAWAQDEEVAVIESGNSVSIQYTLKLDDGTTVDMSRATGETGETGEQRGSGPYLGIALLVVGLAVAAAWFFLK